VFRSWVVSDLICKHYTWLEWIARDKRSSVLWAFVNYDHKKFYNNGPRETIQHSHLALVILSLDGLVRAGNVEY
jgi:hypothetical protein